MALTKHQLSRIKTIRSIELARANLSNQQLKSEHRIEQRIEQVRLTSTFRNVFALAGLGILGSGFKLGKGIYKGIQWFRGQKKKQVKNNN